MNHLKKSIQTLSYSLKLNYSLQIMLISLQSLLPSIKEPKDKIYLKVLSTFENHKVVKILSSKKDETTQKAEDIAANIFSLNEALSSGDCFYLHRNSISFEDSSLALAAKEKNGSVFKALFHLEKENIVSTIVSQNLFTWIHEGGSIDFFRTLFSIREEYLEDVDYHGSTPLHVAAEKGNLELARYLYDLKPALLDQVNDYDETPFHVAAEKGHLPLLQFFYEKNKEFLKIKNSDGDTPFHLCCKNGHLDCAKWLFSKEDELATTLNIPNQVGCTCFEDVCLDENLEMASWILSVNSDCIQTYDPDGNSLFQFLCMENKLKSAQWVIEKREEYIHEVNHKGMNPLHAACKKGSFEVASWLYEKFPFLSHQKNGNNEYPLILAKEADNHVATIKMFFLQGYDPTSLEESKQVIQMLASLSLDEWNETAETTLGTWVSFYLTIERKVNTLAQSCYDMLKSHLPSSFIFSSSRPAPKKGIELIRYYDENIKDLEEIDDPFKEILELFEKIDPSFFLSSEEKENSSPQMQNTYKEKKIRKVEQFLRGIKEYKPDVAIPKGQEQEFYHHLHLIAKHILSYLQNHKDQTSEALTLLEDFLDSYGYCFANFSAKFYSIYQRISPSSEVSKVTSTAIHPDMQFLERLAEDFKAQMKVITSSIILNRDAHDSALFLEFLQKHHIPHPEIQAVADHPLQRAFRIECWCEKYNLVRIVSEESLETRLENYFIRYIKKQFSDPIFFYKTLSKFINNGFKSDEPGLFLEQLTSWLDLQGIAVHDILEWDDEKNQHLLKNKAIFKILQKLPKEISILLS